MLAANPTIASLSDFAKTLDAELRAFRDFMQILQNEQETLIQGNIDHLIELARLKSEKIILLSQLAEQRNHFLRSQGCASDHAGMMHWLERQHGGAMPQIAEIWQQLLDEAKTAHRLNQINGSMIETRLINNQQALAVLKAAANQSGLYGPDGQTQALGLGRPIGKV